MFGVRRSSWRGLGGVEGLEGSDLELGEELVELAGVVEPGLVAGFNGVALRTREATSVDLAEVVAAYRAGESGPAIARRLGCSPARVYALLDEAGVARLPFRATEREDLEAYLAAGFSAQAIAEAHGISTSAVYRALKREGLETAAQEQKRQQAAWLKALRRE